MKVTPDSKFGQEHYVFLDGKKYANAIYADDEAGFIDIVEQVAKEGFITVRLYGKVTFENVFAFSSDPYEV